MLDQSNDCNMPILWQNALGQFRTEIAKKAWIWFAETRGNGMQYYADKYAREVEKLVITLQPMIEASNNSHMADYETTGGLLRFILVRHANNYFGGNVIPHFLKG